MEEQERHSSLPLSSLFHSAPPTFFYQEWQKRHTQPAFCLRHLPQPASWMRLAQRWFFLDLLPEATVAVGLGLAVPRCKLSWLLPGPERLSQPSGKPSPSCLWGRAIKLLECLPPIGSHLLNHQPCFLLAGLLLGLEAVPPTLSAQTREGFCSDLDGEGRVGASSLFPALWSFGCRSSPRWRTKAPHGIWVCGRGCSFAVP